MDRMDDIGKKIDAHLKSGWGRTFLCTTQEVRESITVALMGIRTHLQKKTPLTFVEAVYQRKRCDDVHEQIRTLISRGDKKHARPLRRIVRSYERRLDEMLRNKPSNGASAEGVIAGSGEGVNVGDEPGCDGEDGVA